MEIYKTRKKSVWVYSTVVHYAAQRPDMAFPEQHRILRFVCDDGHTTQISLDKEDVKRLIKQLSYVVDDLPSIMKGDEYNLKGL